MRDTAYVTQLAATVNDMFAEGNTDPSAEEIATAHFEGKALAGEIIESVRKRLNRVRDALAEFYNHDVYLLNRRYYVRYRHNQPTTEAEARLCLPIGHGVQASGIRLNTGENDLIYQVSLSHGMASGAGKVKKGANRTLHAVEDHRLEMPRAAAMLQRVQNQAAPDNLALATEVMQAALPEAEDEDEAEASA